VRERESSRRKKRKMVTNSAYDAYIGEYASILVLFAVGAGLSFLLLGLSYLVGTISEAKGDTEKLSAYECGFDPFDDARSTFDVRFYLVGILFIIFDLEVSFLFPWAVCLDTLPWDGLFSMVLFLGILTVGFVYEWKKGGLNWE
jgi:NADH:ubiquinone oxidoreductase subunit 3 (subunit A)